MKIGIDFGTTNSSVAVARNGAVEMASFASSSGLSESFRSVLYLEQIRQAGGLTGGASTFDGASAPSTGGPPLARVRLRAVHAVPIAILNSNPTSNAITRVPIHLAAAAMTLAFAMPLAAAPRKNVKAPLAPPTPPAMRLGDAVKPLAYEAELTVVPTQERFSGHLVIHVEIAKATEFFWLNAKRLDIRSASLVAGGKSYPAKPVAGGHEFVGLRFASPVPAGRAVITFDYDGVIDRVEAAGIFKQQDGDTWYAFTQFEATDARRAFPCFDEPQWKTPWHMTLIVPATDVVASNTPIASEEPFVAAPRSETSNRESSIRETSTRERPAPKGAADFAAE